MNIFAPETLTGETDIATFEQQLGASFSAYTWYRDWTDSFDASVASQIHDAHKQNTFTWQPQINGTAVVFDDVVSGSYDTYLLDTANRIKALDFPIRIVLAPEMNTDWVSWGTQNAWYSPDTEKAFWRYVVLFFRSHDVTNITWVWAPNVHYNGEKYTYAELYPGDDVVDMVGLDGYNWGTTRPWSTWQSFDAVFRSSYQHLTALTSKPVIITEIASAEQGGNKAAWITDLFQSLSTHYPRIVGITWFNSNKETDWRIQSSRTAHQAFLAALRPSTPSPKPSFRSTVPPSNPPEATSSPDTADTAIMVANDMAQDGAMHPTPTVIPTKTVSRLSRLVIVSRYLLWQNLHFWNPVGSPVIIFP